MDHDQKFKSLFQVFFRDFVAMFVPHYLDMIDFDSVEWLQQEVFLDPPDGESVELDLIAKCRLKEPNPSDDCLSKTHAIIFIEIESPTTSTSIRRRMWRYFDEVEKKQQVDVSPVVVFLNVAKEGIYRDVASRGCLGDRTGELHYWAIGLPGLSAVEYLNKEFPLGWGLTSLMRQDQDPFEIAKQAITKISESNITDFQKYLLYDCVQSYAKVDTLQKKELGNMIRTNNNKHKLIPRNKTIFDEVGEEKDRSRLRIDTSKVIAVRFGQVGVSEFMPKIEQITEITYLERLFDSALTDSPEVFRQNLAETPVTPVN